MPGQHIRVNNDRILAEELRQEKHEADLKWVRERLENAEKTAEEAEENYQKNGGYGTRRWVSYYLDEARLCRLALEGLEDICTQCEHRHRQIRAEVAKLKADKDHGVSTIDIQSVIDLAESLY
ncbi:MAG: hypothetical protein IJ737_08145 [Ruminococcus sp.]|nr:hypothetical protein [Ruminococcus sp.]